MQRLIACLKLTTSNIDGEVIGAARGANRILTAHQVEWDQLLDTLFAQAVYFVEQKYVQAVTIPEALKTLLGVMPPSGFRDVIKSFQQQWIERGSLSDKQRDVLRKAWDKQNPHLTKKAVGF